MYLAVPGAQNSISRRKRAPHHPRVTLSHKRKRSRPEHLADLQAQGNDPIDLVVSYSNFEAARAMTEFRARPAGA